MTMPAAAIDFNALLKVVASTLLITVAFTVMVCAVIIAAARVAEAERAGRTTAVALYSLLTVVAGLTLVGTIMFGLIVMTSK